ncbi:MAG: excinuclease ABC subunit UvrC [Patescibacteria group bacterium]
MNIREILQTISTNPGVYLFKDQAGKILYIGKAKNLKNRVRSYFTRSADLNAAKKIMVVNIADVETVITSTETEAIILESTLIKRHRPPFNVDLKDDKFFLYIKITDDEYPTLETVRRLGKDRSKYFGPYASARSVRTTLKLLKNIFHYRTCRPHQGRPCFDYTIGRCAGPCVDAIGPRQYQEIIRQIISFLRGNTRPIMAGLEKEMKELSAGKKYEKAAAVRDQLTAIQKLRAGQKVVAASRASQDIVSIIRREGLAAVNLFIIRQGSLIDKKNFLLERATNLNNSELLSTFLLRYYPLATDWPKEIIVSAEPREAASLRTLTKARIIVPQKGDKKKLIEMGLANAHDWLDHSEQAQNKRELQAWHSLEELGKALKIPAPRRIEAYDISNIQGLNAVGSMIVFADGLPRKSDYRKFNIRTIQGANDPAMLAEVLVRRFNSSQLAKLPKPDLIILDGGRGQLSVVDKRLSPELKKIPMIAIAKKFEDIYHRGKKFPQRLTDNSLSYFLIQRLRDEAHRFAIGSYRRQHQATSTSSQLDSIPGVGPGTRHKLLKTFGSVAGIKQASPKELTKIVTQKIAKKIYEYLS